MATIQEKMGHLESGSAHPLQMHLHAACSFNNLWNSVLSSNPLFRDRFDEIIESISFSESINCDDMAKFVSNRCHTLLAGVAIVRSIMKRVGEFSCTAVSVPSPCELLRRLVGAAV
jgi:hypothetical protein